MSNHSRRRFLYGAFGGLGALLAGGWIFRRSIVRKLFSETTYNPDITISPIPGGDDMCVLTTRQTEGPFYFLSPERSDIREDRMGVDMRLRLQVVKYPDCTPIEGALVDVWHCDAEGNYSGYPEEISRDAWKSFILFARHTEEKPNGQRYVPAQNENRYLRGLQRTDADGWVEFTSIFPGWYEGRVPHIHAKVILSPEEEVVTQFYFDEAFQNDLYTSTAPYDKHGASPLTIYNDGVVGSTGTNDIQGLMFKPVKRGSKVVCTGKVGIQMA
jgi:protocatechuate 3,4-dioxygenase beta subunit